MGKSQHVCPGLFLWNIIYALDSLLPSLHDIYYYFLATLIATPCILLI